MATHSSTLAWKIPWTEKPGRLQSMGSQRVGHFTSLGLTTPSRAGSLCIPLILSQVSQKLGLIISSFLGLYLLHFSNFLSLGPVLE